MAQDELADPGAFGDAPDLGDIGVQRGHPLQRGTGEAMPLEVAEVSNLVDEDVGALGQGDQIVSRWCRQTTPPSCSLSG